MELKSHNRYAYSPISERPDYDWPDGKRLAVYFALNIEHFSFGEGLGHTPTHPGTPPDAIMHGGTTACASASGAFSTCLTNLSYRPATS